MNWKDQLRKGNIIQTEYGISEICAIAFGDFYVRGKGGRMLHAKVVEPVELTENLIIDFGFTKFYDSHYQRKYEIAEFPRFSYRVVIGNSPVYETGFEYIGTELIKPSHAHQLQNIFLELTGKQLEYKPIS